MADDMFWGGAPFPESTTGADLEPLGYHSDEYESDNEPDYYNPQTGEHTRTRRGRAPKNDEITKKNRIAGGLAPISKPITADYDSDDGRLIELKLQGYSGEYVANKLTEEGRIRYQGKTVDSRFLRLKKILDAKEEERLDDELSDWHLGEDDDLNKITEAVDKKYQVQHEKLEERKWKEISMHFAEKMGKKKYTGNACRERFEGVQAGTALMALQLDPDQAGHRRARESRITAAKKARADAAAAVCQAEEERKAKAEANRREKAEQNMIRVHRLLKRNTDRAERKRIKVERIANKDKAMQQRKVTLVRLRAERDWELEKNRREKELYKKLTGKNLDGKPVRASSGVTKDGYESEEAEESEIDELESDEEEDDADDEIEISDDEDAMVETPGVRRSSRAPPKKTPITKSTPNTDSTPSSKRTPASKTKDVAEQEADDDTPFIKATVTKESLLNPRSIMDDGELERLLKFRDMHPRAADESHAEVVARIADNDDIQGTKKLVELLSHVGEKSRGKKPEKVRVLREADASSSQAAQMGVKSTDLDFIQAYEGYLGEFHYLIAEYEREMAE